MKCILFLFAALASVPLSAQSRYWLIPPFIADMTSGGTLTPAGPSEGSFSYYQKEGVIDSNGRLLFTMSVDSNGIDFVDPNGTRMDFIVGASPVDQAAIVAVPGVCGRY